MICKNFFRSTFHVKALVVTDHLFSWSGVKILNFGNIFAELHTPNYFSHIPSTFSVCIPLHTLHMHMYEYTCICYRYVGRNKRIGFILRIWRMWAFSTCHSLQQSTTESGVDCQRYKYSFTRNFKVYFYTLSTLLRDA